MRLSTFGLLWAASLVTCEVMAMRGQQLQEELQSLATGTRLNRHGEEISATQTSSPTASADSRYDYSPWEFPASLEHSAPTSAAQSRVPTAHPSHQSLISIAQSPVYNVHTPSPASTQGSDASPSPAQTENSSATPSPGVSPDRPVVPEQKRKSFRKLVQTWAQRFRGCTSRARPSQSSCRSTGPSAGTPSPPSSPPPSQRRSRPRSGLRLHSPGRG
ncbi:hypothetical protein BCV69DRAFT_69895 [Microstroma glucosiphilum]|uniref:Uncharacterized protein n=1 Tax=Pseudomicrostroma glucosiphilum TaxID=1684307 RepID=A0A316U1E9_9BASI|nr:hypothetical protein BCV69DRAFT_69895 [Pseudomicrostroma glucosiphilum]PWN18678.1 hypothetical protein BCV69DRAFT_69895 [Pseudomicrostroma glucosiphilum]